MPPIAIGTPFELRFVRARRLWIERCALHSEPDSDPVGHLHMAVNKSARLLTGLQIIVFGGFTLYFGRTVLVPVVVAILLTFLLRPAVVWLERYRIGRGPAVSIVGLLVVMFMLTIGWTLTQQFHQMALHLNEYQGHVRQRMEVFRGARLQSVENVRALIRELTEGPPSRPADRATPSPDVMQESERPPIAIEVEGKPESIEIKAVVPPQSSMAESIQTIWMALSTPLASCAIVTVLVIFMLVGFEELRNRLLRLAGKSRLTVTTRTLDDVGRRISRFLMMNALVNGGFGILVYAGLTVIGVDYAALWGFLAALLRFVPYAGAVVAATLPFAMAVIQFPDWLHPLGALGWFLLLEVITNSFVEPLTYGKTAGVSTVALLVAATFWSWIWGPMGLLLSVPLTVVLAVLGKNIPQFEALGILLSEEPALDPKDVFYQRLVAGDIDEASTLIEDQLHERPRIRVYDDLLIPTLSLAERDEMQGTLDRGEKELVWDNIKDLLDEHSPPETDEDVRDDRVRIVGCAAQNLADDLALEMLRYSSADEYEVICRGSELMASEKLADFAHRPPDAVLISSVAPGGITHIRYLCKRIRQENPKLRIIVGRWGFEGDRVRLSENLRSRGADQVVFELAAAHDALRRIPSNPVIA